ncbi:hypothetical protein GW17_00043477 [Ensete ventricosum]|nr:hypothetical protein GW17_00043477 [Ensete ventricosum]
MPRTVPKECNVRRSWEVVLGVVCLYVYWAGTAGSGPCALVHPRSSRHRGGARLEGRNPRVRLRKPAACAVESGRVGSTAKSCKKVGSGGVPNVTSLTVKLVRLSNSPSPLRRGVVFGANLGDLADGVILGANLGDLIEGPISGTNPRDLAERGFGPGVISGVNLGDLVEGPISGTNPGDLAERVISGTNLGDLAEGPISGTNLGDLAERVTRAQILEIWPRGQSRALNPGDLVEGSISGTNPGDLAEELISGTNPGDLAEKVISGTNLGDLTERILVALRDLEVMKADHDLDTTMTEGSLAVIRERYNIPVEYGLHVPQPGQRPFSSDVPSMCISMDALEVGLRFPLHPLIEECLKWWRISPS